MSVKISGWVGFGELLQLIACIVVLIMDLPNKQITMLTSARVSENQWMECKSNYLHSKLKL